MSDVHVAIQFKYVCYPDGLVINFCSLDVVIHILLLSNVIILCYPCIVLSKMHSNEAILFFL